MDWGWQQLAIPLVTLALGGVIGHQFRRMELLRQDRLTRYARYLEVVNEFRWWALRGTTGVDDSFALFTRLSAAEADLLLVASKKVLETAREIDLMMRSDEYSEAFETLVDDPEPGHSAAGGTIAKLTNDALILAINAMRDDLGTRRSAEVEKVLRRGRWGSASGGCREPCPGEAGWRWARHLPPVLLVPEDPDRGCQSDCRARTGRRGTGEPLTRSRG